MKYTITINEEETATSDSLDTIIAFQKAARYPKKISLDWIELNGMKNGITLTGINCNADFKEVCTIYKLGR